jgi:hypothetical protein
MKLLFNAYQKELLVFYLILILSLWAIIASYVAITKKDHTLLVGINQNGATIISSLDDKSELTLTKNFLRRFIGLTYNWDHNSFRENIELAGDLMSDELWSKKLSDFKLIETRIKESDIIQSAEILGITRLDENVYEVPVKTSIIRNGRNYSEQTKIRITLKKIERNLRNPWGMEVINVSEERK